MQGAVGGNRGSPWEGHQQRMQPLRRDGEQKGRNLFLRGLRPSCGREGEYRSERAEARDGGEGRELELFQENIACWRSGWDR